MSEDKIGIDVVIPTIGRTSLLRAIESVTHQSHQPDRIFIVDDSLSQNIEISGFDVEILRTGGARGPSFARNIGVSRATSNWIAFLDDDDYWSQKHLATLLEFAESKNLDVAISSANVGGLLRPTKLFKGDVDPLRALYGWPRWRRTTFYIPMPGMLIKRNVFDKVQFNNFMREREDLWLVSEIYREKFKIQQCSNPTLIVQPHSLASIKRTSFKADLQWARKLGNLHSGMGLSFMLGIGFRNLFLRILAIPSIWVWKLRAKKSSYRSS